MTEYRVMPWIHTETGDQKFGVQVKVNGEWRTVLDGKDPRLFVHKSSANRWIKRRRDV